MKRISIQEFKQNFDIYFRLAEFENLIITDGDIDLVEILLFRKNNNEKIKITTLNSNGRKVLAIILGLIPEK